MMKFFRCNRSFGLYDNETNSEEKFEEMSIIKNDKNALEFSKWFKIINEERARKTISKFYKATLYVEKTRKTISKIKNYVKT